MKTYTVVHYVDAVGKDALLQWLKSLRDPLAKTQIIKRLNRLAAGNFGDHRFCRSGVWELRIDVGQGYRVYYAVAGDQLVLLLCGGDKRTQDKDIERAIHHWNDWQHRP
jgi:putative addiction module killer protein